MKGYSTREVAELLELSPTVIRDIARGVLDPEKGPKDRYKFSFQDIVIFRTAKELLQTGVQRSKINSTLFRLRDQLPGSKPLTSLRISGDGGAVVLQENDKVYNPESGQLHFNFAVADLAGTVAPLARKAASEAEEGEQLSSDDWFDLGVDLEAVSPEDAPAAYLHALEIEPDHTDAHVNLGRLYQESGEYELAESHYHSVLKIEPDNILAAFNLGTLLEDLGRIQDAIIAYKKAGAFADAHYNLSRLYELVGEHQQALKHLKTYRSLIEPR